MRALRAVLVLSLVVGKSGSKKAKTEYVDKYDLLSNANVEAVMKQLREELKNPKISDRARLLCASTGSPPDQCTVSVGNFRSLQGEHWWRLG